MPFFAKTPPPKEPPRRRERSALSQSQQIEAALKAISSGKADSLATLFFDCPQVSHKALSAIASRPELARRSREAAQAEAARRQGAHPLEEALSECCARASHEKVALLIDLGALLSNTRTSALARAIEAAPLDPSLSLAKRLLSYGLNPNEEDRAGRLPLNAAFFLPPPLRERAFELLLDAGANPFLMSSGRSLPVCFSTPASRALAPNSSAACLAAFLGPDSALDRFLTALKTPTDADRKDEWGRSVLTLAVLAGSETRARALARAGASLSSADRQGRSALHVACETGSNPDMARVLIELGADLRARDSQGSTPLALAVSRAHAEGQAALDQAGQLRLMDLLLAAGADPNARDNHGDTPAREAVELRFPEPLRRLLAEGSDPNHARADGKTLLHRASELRLHDHCLALLSSGADPNRVDSQGASPAHIAILNSSALILSALLKAGADPNHANAVGASLARAAISHRAPESLLALLNAGANPNQRDSDERSLLHHACAAGSLPLCEALLRAGADPLAKDRLGATAGEALGALARPTQETRALAALMESAEISAELGEARAPFSRAALSL